MFRNYFAAALRNLGRNRLYSFISVAGLGTGLAAALLIALFVRDEISFENFIPHHERTYLLSETLRIPGASPIVIAASPAELAAWAKADVAGIEAIARILPEDGAVRRGNVEAQEAYAWADENLFDVLALAPLAGDPGKALAVPDGLVLTRAMARRFFGRDAPLGEVLEIGGNRLQMRVLAVLHDLPYNTHIDIQIFLSAKAAGSPVIERDARPSPLLSGSNSANSLTFMRLARGAQPADVQRQIEAGVLRRAPAAKGMNPQFPVTALGDVHLRPELGNDALSGRSMGSMTTLYAVSAVAVLIVLVAVSNLVNLITARATRRATEIGVRKAAGATRGDLILQFMGEALLYVACGMLVAIALTELLLPHFNAFLGREILFPYLRNPVLAGTLVLAVPLLAMLTGFYPALVLSAFHPAEVMKGSGPTSGGSGSSVTRFLLVTSQFAIVIGLVVCTSVIYRQTRFALQDGLRFDQDQMLVIQGACRDGLRQAIAALPGVRGTACSMSAPTLARSTQSTLRRADDTQVLMYYGAADEGFFELYGLQPLAGRFFSRARPGDVLDTVDRTGREALVINQTAARKLGYASPQAAVGSALQCSHFLGTVAGGMRGGSSGPRSCEIVGVAPDFATQSIRMAIEPSAWYLHPPQLEIVSVKLRGQQVPETLTAIDRLWKELGDGPIRRTFLQERVQAQYTDIMRQGTILGAFSVVAVLLGCLGLFGLSAFTAERRMHEIGVRKAMGAATGDIVRLLVWQFTRPVIWASLIAWPAAAFAMSRWLGGFAYHVVLDPMLFVAATCLAIVVSLITVSAHCVIAARTPPAVSLRAI